MSVCFENLNCMWLTKFKQFIRWLIERFSFFRSNRVRKNTHRYRTFHRLNWKRENFTQTFFKFSMKMLKRSLQKILFSSFMCSHDCNKKIYLKKWITLATQNFVKQILNRYLKAKKIRFTKQFFENNSCSMIKWFTRLIKWFINFLFRMSKTFLQIIHLFSKLIKTEQNLYLNRFQIYFWTTRARLWKQTSAKLCQIQMLKRNWLSKCVNWILHVAITNVAFRKFKSQQFEHLRNCKLH